jgi:cytoskeletal protein CcmA (bactofilin family)
MRGQDAGTVIGSQVKLSGTLEDRSSVAIFGKVDGEIVAGEDVSVHGGAQVKGPISGKRVSIEGVVRGNIKADERVEILPKGKLAGSLEAKDLVIHSGAIFNGRANMPEIEEKLKETKVVATEKTNEGKETSKLELE